MLFVFGTSILAMRVFLTSFSWELMASTWKHIVEHITETWTTLESIWRTVLLTVSSSGIKARAMESTAPATPTYWRYLPNFKYLLGKIYFGKSYFRALPEPLKLLLPKALLLQSWAERFCAAVLRKEIGLESMDVVSLYTVICDAILLLRIGLVKPLCYVTKYNNRKIKVPQYTNHKK